MFLVTDIVVLILLAYYAFTGWRKGIIRSLLGPVSLLVCIYAAWAYFQKTHNIAISFTISFFGPMLVNFLGSILVRLIVGVDAWAGKSGGVWTRVLGAGINLIWGGAMVGIMVLLFALSPVNLFQTGNIKKDVLASKTFAFLSQRLQGYLPRMDPALLSRVPSGEQWTPERAGSGAEGLPAGGKFGEQGMSSSGPATLPRPQDILPEARALLEDERVKAMLADPQVKQLIEEKKYMQLLNTPSFQKILEDPQLVMKFLEINKKMGGQLTLPGAVENEVDNERK